MNTKSELLRKSVLSVLIPLLSGFSAYAEQPGPMLVPDYNRDGMIDAADFERARDGEAFTIWLNDDDDAEGTEGGLEAGDTNTDLHDVPGGEGNDRDCDDDTVTGCESGFYYSLYGAAGVRALPETGTAYGPNLCGADGKMMFWEVKKPSDAAGFFTIGVDATKGE